MKYVSQVFAAQYGVASEEARHESEEPAVTPADEGTTYSDLPGEVRARVREALSRARTISASEVAHRVGFTEPPAFFEAFKRWTE